MSPRTSRRASFRDTLQSKQDWVGVDISHTALMKEVYHTIQQQKRKGNLSAGENSPQKYIKSFKF